MDDGKRIPTQTQIPSTASKSKPINYAELEAAYQAAKASGPEPRYLVTTREKSDLLRRMYARPSDPPGLHQFIPMKDLDQ